MTDFPKARLFYLTDPEPDVLVVNIQTEPGELHRATITYDQLRHFLREGVSLHFGKRA